MCTTKKFVGTKYVNIKGDFAYLVMRTDESCGGGDWTMVQAVRTQQSLQARAM